jgi:uncharacterized damage-inducible protein DinB
MTKDEIQLLFEYDRWATNRVLQAASTLSAQDFTRDLRGSFRSMRDTLVHLIGSQKTWMTYWKEPSPTAALLGGLWDRHDVIFAPNAFPDFAAVQSLWAEVEREQLDFVSCATDESLQRMLPVGAKQISLAHLMQHLANHSTYHRGQVAVMMRQLSATPVATDFAKFLLEGRQQATAQ